MAERQISLTWLLLPLCLLAVGLYTNWTSQTSGIPKSPAIGKPAPQLDLVLLSNTRQFDRLDQLPEGKVLLVHFWGTWCGPCKMEYPLLNSMARKYEANAKFQFVPVSCESTDSETFAGLIQKTGRYFDSQRIDSFAFADPLGITRRSAAERLDQNSLYYPTSLVISSEGKIAGAWQGYTPTAVSQIDQLIAQLLLVPGES